MNETAIIDDLPEKEPHKAVNKQNLKKWCNEAN